MFEDWGKGESLPSSCSADALPPPPRGVLQRAQSPSLSLRFPKAQMGSGLESVKFPGTKEEQRGESGSTPSITSFKIVDS